MYMYCKSMCMIMILLYFQKGDRPIMHCNPLMHVVTLILSKKSVIKPSLSIAQEAVPWAIGWTLALRSSGVPGVKTHLLNLFLLVPGSTSWPYL